MEEALLSRVYSSFRRPISHLEKLVPPPGSLGSASIQHDNVEPERNHTSIVKMVYISPQGRDWSSVVNFDALGKLYVAITVAWTVILYTGVTWLTAEPQPVLPQDAQHLPWYRLGLLPPSVPRQDPARLHHQWTFFMRRRILDNEHLSSLRNCPLPGQHGAAAQRQRSAKEAPRRTCVFGSRGGPRTFTGAWTSWSLEKVVRHDPG